MSRSIPGFGELGKGREVIYVEVSDGENFRWLMSEVLASCPAVPLPQSGGVIEEKTRLQLPDKTSLLAISYKGDLQGWRRKIVSFCEEKRKKWGVPKSQMLVLSDGTEVPVPDCDVVFEP